MRHLKTADEILRIVSRWEPFLLTLPSDAADARAGSSWTVKQLVGHLVDSALNHHHLWVRLHDGDVEFPRYEQNDWVARAGYAEFPWQDLVRLWAGHNRLLASVAMQVPTTALPNRWRDGERNLDDLLAHYVEHLRHHLAAIERALD